MVNLTKRIEIEDWLRTLPATAMTSFAARMALRELPYAFPLKDQEVESFDPHQILLTCLRSNIVSVVAGTWPMPQMSIELTTAARSADTNARSAARTTNAAADVTAYSSLTAARAAARSASRYEDSAAHIATYTARTDDSSTQTAAHVGLTAGRNIARTDARAADATALTASPQDTMQLFSTKLWNSEMPGSARDLSLHFFDSAQGTPWFFWAEWYEGMLDGRPLDWTLQRQVALIDDTYWKEGPEAVAKKIAKIRARWNVETTLSNLNRTTTIQSNSRLGIGGNNPPEDIELEKISVSSTQVWDAAQELSAALEQEEPRREWVEKILIKLKAGLAGLLKWSIGKVNLAVSTAVLVGTTRGATAVADNYIAKHPEKVEALIEALERWLPFLS